MPDRAIRPGHLAAATPGRPRYRECMMTSRLRSLPAWPIAAALVPLLVLFAAACGDGDDDVPGATSTPAAGITITEPWVRASANDTSAAYMLIANNGAEDRLVSASTPISPKVQIHEVVVEGPTSKMQEIPGGLAIAANSTTQLKPGGYHIMMMALTDPLEVGEKVELALNFEKAGSISITAEVREGSTMSGGMTGTKPTPGTGMTTPVAGMTPAPTATR